VIELPAAARTAACKCPVARFKVWIHEPTAADLAPQNMWQRNKRGTSPVATHHEQQSNAPTALPSQLRMHAWKGRGATEHAAAVDSSIHNNKLL